MTLLLPLFAVHSDAPSNVRPAAPSPTARVPRTKPSPGRIRVSVPLKKLDTQTLVPSKATPNGPLPTGKVPRLAPSLAPSFVTVLSRLFATQMFTPSEASPKGR